MEIFGWKQDYNLILGLLLLFLIVSLMNIFITRYNHDAEETRDWILEKYEALSIEDLGKDLRSVQALQRKHEGSYFYQYFSL